MSLVPDTIISLAEDDSIGGGKNIVAGASVNITKITGGSASIFSDSAGSSAISLPTVTDSSGELKFWIAAGQYIYTVAGENYNVNISEKNDFVVETFADLATTPATTAGMIVYIKQHTSGGVGGGYFQDTAGTITNDGGTLINNSATAGRHWKAINYANITPEMFGHDTIITMSTTELGHYLDAGGYVEEVIGIGANFTEQILLDQRDVVLQVMSDSTANETDEWVYLTALTLADLYPTHSVEYALWNTTSYSAPVSISTGTGSNTIYINNASIPGATAAYFLGDNRPAVYNSMTPDLVIFSYGHNMGTSANYEQIFNFHFCAYAEFVSDNPAAEFVVTIQNVDTDYPVYSGLQASANHAIASILGFGVVDVRKIFCEKILQGGIADWLRSGDPIHPNATGEKVWANILKYALTADIKMPCVPRNILANSASNLIYNDSFYRWVWSDALPSSYEINSYATAAKDSDLFETKGFSIELTSTGTSGQIGILTNNAGGVLQKINKKYGATFSARVFPSTGSSFNCGRVEVDLGGGVVVSSWPRTEPKNGWYWSSVYVTAAQLAAATQFKLSVYSGDTTDVVNVDRITINEGNVLIDSKFKPIKIDEFYDPSNVFGKTANDVLVITGDEVECTNSVDAYPGFRINILDLEVGESYTVTWVSAISAANSAVLLRSFGGVGAVQQTVTPLNVNTMVFTAIADSAGLQFEILTASAGTDTFTITDISIVKT